MSDAIELISDTIELYAEDGTKISMGGEYTSPVKFKLNAEENESQIQRLKVRVKDGREVAGLVTIKSTFGERFTFSKTEDGEFAESISFDAIGADGEIFYVKATSSDSELPTLEKTTGIEVKFPMQEE